MEEIIIPRDITWLIGAQKQGLSPMNTRYIALLKLMIVPVVANVLATSGTADRTVVDDIGARNPQKASTHVMTTLRWGDSRSYTESSISGGFDRFGMFWQLLICRRGPSALDLTAGFAAEDSEEDMEEKSDKGVHPRQNRGLLFYPGVCP